MVSGINVPLELAVLLCMAALAAGVWAGRRREIRRLDPRRNPLADLMHPETLTHAVDLATRRNAVRGASQAVLHGRIDQLAAMRNVWSPETRDQVHGHVAAVMRAGLRRDDKFIEAEGDGFTIIIPGADERTAARIADRLRRSLARLRLSQLGGNAHLTASFGVAAEQFGDTDNTLVRRAQQALKAALAQGNDHVITASEIEDVTLLPSPEPAAVTASAA